MTTVINSPLMARLNALRNSSKITIITDKKQKNKEEEDMIKFYEFEQGEICVFVLDIDRGSTSQILRLPIGLVECSSNDMKSISVSDFFKKADDEILVKQTVCNNKDRFVVVLLEVCINGMEEFENIWNSIDSGDFMFKLSRHDNEDTICYSDDNNNVLTCSLFILPREKNENILYIKGTERKDWFKMRIRIPSICKLGDSIPTLFFNLKERFLQRLEEQKKNFNVCSFDVCSLVDQVPIVFTYFIPKSKLNLPWEQQLDVNERELSYKKLGLSSKLCRILHPICDLSVLLETKPSDVVRSPHLGQFGKSHGIQDAKEFMIFGDFDYYHYGVGGFQDKGWGCAYRSLQMVASWYRLNGFTDKSPPSIPEIQDILVKSGAMMDPQFFKGCKKWIGSQEISWVLNSLIDIDCRFVTCPSGSKIPSILEQLLQHLEQYKTPIIACGGKLALTIVGIAHNNLSKQVKYLIADPHYSEFDDLKTIQTKIMPLEGYKAAPVSWRGADAFSKSSTYTFVLPLL